MCGNKKLPSAISTCCGSYDDRLPSVSSQDDYADVLSEYRGERLTYKGNENRCADWNRTVCDPSRIGPFSGFTGHCLSHQSCRDVSSNAIFLKDGNRYHWTNETCSIQVKVQDDGLIAIVHAPAETTFIRTTNDTYPVVQSHVNAEKTVAYFHVNWENTGGVCAAGEVSSSAYFRLISELLILYQLS